jgi:uncharacterized protein YoxC
MPDNGSGRLDRIEHALELLIDDHERFRHEHKQLLTAQIILTEQVDKLAQHFGQLAEHVGHMAEHLDKTTVQVGQLAQHTDALTLKVDEIADKLNGLISYLDAGHQPPQ